MSFYGSVYYQLIDTFYKIIVKNSGSKTYNFNTALLNPEGTAPEDIVESPAIGRKGVFSLDSGNYWINFSKNNNTLEAAPYKIWHSPANTNPTSILPVGGLKIETDNYIITEDTAGNETSIVDKEGNELIEGENYIQLQDHEFIRTYNTQYDEAGHIIDEKTESILYRLPKANVNARVDRMETILGQPSEGLEFPRPDLPAVAVHNLPENEEYEGDVILSVTDYAEKNFEDIKLLEQFVGHWEQSHNRYYDHAPSITEWIGDLDTLYGENQEYAAAENREDTLVRILGDLPTMRKLYEGEETVSISDVFQASKNSNDSQFETVTKAITTAQDGVNALNFIVGDFEGRAKIYEELDLINADIVDITTTIGDQGSKDDVYTEIDKLNTIIGDSSGKQSVYEEISSINNIIGNQENKDTVYKELSSLDTAISNINTTIGTPGTKNNVYSEIDKIYTTIGTQGDKGAIYYELQLANEAINSANTNIQNHVNTVNEALQSINTEIGGLRDDCADFSESVWAAIGTDEPEPTQSINARIKANTESIQALTDFVGSNEESDNTLVEQIASIVEQIGDNETEDTILYHVANIENTIGEVDNFNGTIKEHIVDIEKLIGTKDSSESTIIARLGAMEPVVATVDGINTTVKANTAAINAINQTITPLAASVNEHGVAIENLQTTIIPPLSKTVDEYGQAIGAIEASIAPLEQTIASVNQIGASIGDLASIPEGQTILNLLLDLSNQIEGIKVKINELHPGSAEDFSDYPFPDVIQSNS